MAKRDVDCPSGLTGVLRGLKGKEMRLLTDKRKAKSGELFDDLIQACWLQVTNPGPYRLDAKGMPTWLDVLSGDRFYVLVQLRVATYPGEPYTFPVQCGAPACGEAFQWEVPLEDLEVKRLPEESLRRFKEGIPFETQLDGATIKFELGTGRHERRGSRFARGAGTDLMRIMSQRIISIEGVDKKDIVDWLEDRELSEHRDLLVEMDKVDCGVKTSIEVVCPECGNVQPVDLPFGPAFFMPRKPGMKTS